MESIPGRVHLIGVGGARMSALARIFAVRGISVSGSDQVDSDVLQDLRDEGVTVRSSHSVENLNDAEMVVISPAVRETNLELVAARQRGIPVITGAEAMAMAFASLRSIGVAGSHGKTTTAGMTASILIEAGADPSFVIGSHLIGIGPGGRAGKGELAVIEADEAYGSFLHLRCEVGVLTSADVDHLDHYKTRGSLMMAFKTFLERCDRRTVCADHPAAVAVAGDMEFSTYGFSHEADVRIVAVRSISRGSVVTMVLDGGSLEMEVPWFGRFNAQNAAGAASAARLMDIPVDTIAAGLTGFKGTSGRFELKGEVNGVRVIEDYAHLPEELVAALKAARAMTDGRLIAVFQPHLFSRTVERAGDFASALSVADMVVVTDIFAAREDPLPGVSGRLISEKVSPRSRPAAFVRTLEEAADLVAEAMRPGDIVLCLGAGDVSRLPALILQADA